MATNTGIAPPNLSEDSGNRFAPDPNTLPRRFVKKTQTLADGTNVGGTTDYVLEVVGTQAVGASGTTQGVDSSGRASVSIDAATVTVPVDVQALYRTQSILTTATLGAAGVYTSPSVDGINFRRITGVAFSNVAGSLAIQQSDDGTTWDTITTVTVAAATPIAWDQVIHTRYVRYVYTNGATLQTTFRLSGYLAAA